MVSWSQELIMSDLPVPKGYSLRFIEPEDYDKGICQAVGQLTQLGHVSRSMFIDYVEHLHQHSDIYHTLVIANEKGEIIGSGSVVLERKLIHGCGLVGHIEDIIIASTQQGKGLGKLLIQALDYIAVKKGAYKNILNCSSTKIPFYVKCGYANEGVLMVRFEILTL